VKKIFLGEKNIFGRKIHFCANKYLLTGKNNFTAKNYFWPKKSLLTEQ